ncbi:phosphatidylinositol kinase-related protein kinase TOR1 NDAI_0A03960 [Naumovozyma dairenensis CBS 421]|uniref:non-specific serine/threonine protein kinase n=1 Tax=Naumovozyma dairenensis (strain ATCC 10597 / BCRC 20456 / CBS 421 / NBRC 0211 / NRRL Y-12639) TaxID=1071378 RepID=G0W415_NAUDC|nr:hypothetical protein NDAI_0A03960 [Naumovozyma dairenensis CBS 421]CCD22553.1 hypothetical protein NDAI_0A03960 [Naumovozyma dairenensis CBS 421]
MLSLFKPKKNELNYNNDATLEPIVNGPDGKYGNPTFIDEHYYNSLELESIIPTIEIGEESRIIDQLLEKLKSPKPTDKALATYEFKLVMSALNRESSVEQLTKFNNILNKKILASIQSSSANEKISGILVLRALQEYYAQNETLPSQISRILSLLRLAIPCNDIEVMKVASNTLGELASLGGSLTSDFVESQMKTCIEWLVTVQDKIIVGSASKTTNKKHTALHIIISLADYVPYLLFRYVNSILDNIWHALRDKSLLIRTDAATTLQKCLQILARRDGPSSEIWNQRLLDECMRGFDSDKEECIHGTLLVYKVLLTLEFGYEINRYDEMYHYIMLFKENKSDLIRREVYLILPKLASRNHEAFITKHLSETMVFLLTSLKNLNVNIKHNIDNELILICIADLAVEINAQISPYLNTIFEIIINTFKLKYKNTKITESALFYCIGKLSLAVGARLLHYLNDTILDLFFIYPFPKNMQEALTLLSQEIPTLQPKINSRLLDLLSLSLSGVPFVAPGSPTSFAEASVIKARHWRNKRLFERTGEMSSEMNDDKLVIQTFKILNETTYECSLTEFVRCVTLLYIEHDDPEIRKYSAITSCDIFGKDNICKQTSIYALDCVNEVLSKLLAVAITDPVPAIRLELLLHLNTHYDSQLAQPENAQLLFTLLNDEMFSIRVEVLKIIGRLVSINPAFIIPFLRKTLLELLTQLKYSVDLRKSEETATLLCTLISSSKDITKPYIEPILECLLTTAKDKSSTVSTIALKTIGELSVVGGEEMIAYLDTLMPIIIDTLQDQSKNFKRDAALKTLGQLTESSGYVIDPLLDYPELLSVLMGILKSDNSQTVRRETVKLIGILGALDPYRYREVEVTSTAKLTVDQNMPSIDMALLMQGLSTSSEEYLLTVVFNNLIKILNDPSLSSHYTSAIQAIMQIFETLRLNCVSYLRKVVPSFLSVIDNCPSSLSTYYFKQLAVLVSIVKDHIRPYVEDIYRAIEKNFKIQELRPIIITLIDSICTVLGAEFKKQVPLTLTLFLEALNDDPSENKAVTIQIMKSLTIINKNLEDYTYLIIPTVLKFAEFSTREVAEISITTLGKLIENINLNSMSTRIIQVLSRLLDTADIELRNTIMNTLSLLLLRLETDFTIYVPLINKALLRNNIENNVYDSLVSKLLNGEPLPETMIISRESQKIAEPESIPISQKLPVNQPLLQSTWDCTQQSTKEDWQEWLRRLSIQLLKESPSHALRACAGLAGIYYPLARDLFNSAFASVWVELYSQYQENLIQSLCLALSSYENPPEIHQTILNLVEFMDHDDKPLPISIPALGEYAEKCHAYAKVLHYKELRFIQEPLESTIESLISINNQLYQTDAAVGILKYAQEYHGVGLHETWYEKLERWEEALRAYDKRESMGDDSNEVIIGKMRSYYALSEWDQLLDITEQKWANLSSNVQKLMAPYAAGAAWSLGRWDQLELYSNILKKITPNREFFVCYLKFTSNNFASAEQNIFTARDLLVTELSALINESYARAYNVVVRTQMLAELDEIIQYKRAPVNSNKRAILRQTWDKRLLGSQKSIDIWQRALRIRSLVIKPKQDMMMWIKFANLCRRSNKMILAQKALNLLLEDGGDPSNAKAPPPVVYAQLKFLWAGGAKKEALRHLIGFTSRMAQDLGLDPSNLIAQKIPQSTPVSHSHVEEYTKLLARCFLKQGEWRTCLQPSWRQENPDAILGSYLLATHFDKNWYKAWHNWALANFEVISVKTSQIKEAQENKLNETRGADENLLMEQSINANIEENQYSTELIQRHVVPAIIGFFHSIALLEANSLQDTLRLLTLWFTFGGISGATQAMHEGFGMIKIGIWLDVLPQLISRIHQPNEVVSMSLLSLLSNLGKAHPQALVYPLTVAIKSESVSRQKAALSIIEKMRMHSPVLVGQAELVSDELIRVAVLWQEQWYEGLEDASRYFFGEQNVEKMFATLTPLHKMLQGEPETAKEAAFKKMYERDLADAYEWAMNYKRTKEVNNLNQAWDIYYNVFRKISRQLPQIQTLELQLVSPKLLEAHDLELAIPGTYSPGKPIIKIVSFDSTFSIISSKQRPRKFSIRGSDGKDYRYVLKGHEDIRQDSLVMQLFGLVNTLLQNDTECFQRHLDIQRYPAIPLSPKSGLLGWVRNSDTFHMLIKEHREAKKIPLNIEHWAMLQMAPDYDNLTLLEKIEVFSYSLQNTKGQDFQKVLWLKSRSSETWLERRTMYTRSLAVMSMVGYILGLGDRHPSNLMLDRITGKVIHIDFGDCFEAAILREKFPEKVPFRLTRMLTFAMEVSGVEGSFRITSENVMRVLRDNKESLMAILEAFAFDPLINWGFDFPTEKIIEETGILLPVSTPNELLRKGAITAEEASDMETDRQAELRNGRALLVLRRITDKLTGNDFKRSTDLDVATQLDKLIKQATSVENLCQHYIGWCPFW